MAAGDVDRIARGCRKPQSGVNVENRTGISLRTGESDTNFKNFICVRFRKPYKVLHFDMWSFAPLRSHGSRAL